MSRIEETLRRSLDGMEARDLWPIIADREPSVRVASNHRRRHSLTALLAIVIAIGSVAAAASLLRFKGPATDQAGSMPAQPGSGTGEAASFPTKASAKAEGFPLQCSVEILTPIVRKGERVETLFGYQNIGLSAYRLPIDGGSPRLLVYDQSGALVWDTDPGPYDVAGIDSGSDLEEVLPGEVLFRKSGFAAEWVGALTLTPLCGYGTIDANRVFTERGVVEVPSLVVLVTE